MLSLQALADPYFVGLANLDQEPSRQPISKLEFEFERSRLTKDDVRELIYREILEYHPKMLQDYLQGSDNIGFMYPSGVDRFRRQFEHLEAHYGKGERSTALQRKHASLPRERVCMSQDEAAEQNGNVKKSTTASVGRAAVHSPQRSQEVKVPEPIDQNGSTIPNGVNNPNHSPHSLWRSDSISASKCVVMKSQYCEEDRIAGRNEEMVNVLS